MPWLPKIRKRRRIVKKMQLRRRLWEMVWKTVSLRCEGYNWGKRETPFLDLTED